MKKEDRDEKQEKHEKSESPEKERMEEKLYRKHMRKAGRGSSRK